MILILIIQHIALGFSFAVLLIMFLYEDELDEKFKDFFVKIMAKMTKIYTNSPKTFNFYLLNACFIAVLLFIASFFLLQLIFSLLFIEE